MSTFDGIIQEFPYIQIDYFRKNPERPPPLACFLSHVHSDHLQGLESFRAPFIYCSAATRELLLRIEKYPHRMNFSKGILESRRLHYKHLSKLLRPIPLNTPTEIELTPRLSIRVTLLDANHCAGAVMFLIEGGGKAVLYTGDIRAESWWVNSLIRHPVLIPYTLGNKSLDKVYLDSTFARANHVCRAFPQKAEGLAELLQKVECYPQDTTFYFRAWTFGYEDVWVALSAILNSKVHVDRYQMGLYRSLISCSREGNSASEAPSLCGFELGNRFVSGCLSEDEGSRIHSCEPGVHCPTISSKSTVYIIPIVSQMKDGSKVPETGAGGGGGDLYQAHELELPDQSALEQLEKLCLERIHDPETLSQMREALLDAFKSRSKALSLDSYGMKDASDIPLEKLVSILSRGRSGEGLWAKDPCSPVIRSKSGDPLPRVIYFPYSRHSSYMELCELVSAFKPKDIYPCTVDPLSWSEDVSMQTLFGHLCAGTEFTHDKHMRDTIANDDDLHSRKRPRYEGEFSPQSSQRSTSMIDSGPRAPVSLVSTETNKTIDQTTYRARETEAPGSHPAATISQPPSSITHQEIAYLPGPRMIPSSSLSSSERIPLPSSLETLPEHDHTHTYNEPLDVPKSNPEMERAKRNEIRRAWRFLNNTYSEHGHFHLGPLPSSWPTQEEDNSDVLDPDPSHQTNEVPGLGKEYEEPEPNFHGNKTPYTIPNSPHEVDMDVNVEINDDNEDELDIDTNSQQTNTLSISSSAFASQQQDLELELQDYDHSEQEDEVTNHEHGNKSIDPTSTPKETNATLSLNRSSSSRARRAAYLAAKADSYEAWASIGLLSTGDNHTKKEMEL